MAGVRRDRGDATAVLVVRARPGGKPHEGLLHYAGRSWPCALGRAGIASIKREGDGATPRGRFRLLAVLYRADRGPRPATILPTQSIRADDGWCDAPEDANYNRPVRLPYRASHEALMRQDRLYDIVVVTDHNMCPRMRGAGSAIFLHIARPDFAATAGCVALAPQVMRAILARLPAEAYLTIG